LSGRWAGTHARLSARGVTPPESLKQPWQTAVRVRKAMALEIVKGMHVQPICRFSRCMSHRLPSLRPSRPLPNHRRPNHRRRAPNPRPSNRKMHCMCWLVEAGTYM
jgi:hypothetical protein